VKTAVYSSYGPPDFVQINEISKPGPNDNGVLIRVRAASVNPVDWHCTSESGLALKPGNVTFEQVASVPAAAFTAHYRVFATRERFNRGKKS